MGAFPDVLGNMPANPFDPVPLGGGTNAAATAKPGFSINNLLQNKLFLQYLSSLGSALSTHKPAGAAIGSTTQQTIQGINYQNYLNAMRDMLSGNIKEGGKIVHTDTGTQIHIPREHLTGSAAGEAAEAGVSPTTPKTTGSASVSGSDINGTQPNMLGNVNPFASSQPFSASDLAGLTPELMTEAFKTAMGESELRNKSINDIIENQLKQAQIGNIQSEIRTREAPPEHPEREETEIIKNFRFYQSQGGKLPFDEYQRSVREEGQRGPSSIDEYEYAKKNGYKGSYMDFMDKRQRSQNEPTSIREYEYAKKQGFKGSYQDWTTGLAVGKKAAVDTQASRDYFSSGKLKQDVDKHLASAGVKQALISAGLPGSTEYNRAARNETIKYIEGEIATRKGEIVGVRREGNTGVWIVQFPNSAATDEVKYELQ